MSSSKRIASRLRLVRPTSALPTQRCCRRCFASAVAKDEKWPQRIPLGEYYESILNHPTPYPFDKKPEQPPSTAAPDVLPPERRPEPPSKKEPAQKPEDDGDTPKTPSNQSASPDTPTPEPAPPPASAQEKARIIFGSRLLGPAEQQDRLAMKRAQSTYVAGVLVPPRPEEPDNCCMSGCVNCVWDRYREDLEEWSAQKNEAEARLKAAGSAIDADEPEPQARVEVEVGSSKIAKDMWDDEVFQSVPVGIREFMKQEKRLKERHEQEGTLGG